MIAVAALLATSTAAQDTGATQCTQSAASDIISVVICPAGLDDVELAEAGKTFCAERLPCGAWIWTNAADAPETAPENHDGLTQAQVTSSVGVWVAEQEQFISIEKVN